MGREEIPARFWWENLSERSHFEDQGLDGMTILGCIFRKWDVGINCIDMAQDRDRWWALLNTVISLRVP
jgi:hypothetical protein